MTKLLIKIYHFFNLHKSILWLVMIVSFLIMTTLSTQLKFTNDITDFLPKNESDQSLIFKGLKAKDKLIVNIQNTSREIDPNVLIEAAQQFEYELFAQIDSSYVIDFSLGINENSYKYTLDYIFDNLPIFVQEDDYKRIDSIINTKNGVDDVIKENYQSLISSTNFGQSDLILTDPLHLANYALNELQNLNTYNNIVIYNNFLFSDNFNNLYFFINSSNGGAASKQNEKLIKAIESSFYSVEQKYPNINFYYYGAPAVATYNAHQIQQDLMITLNVALILILLIVLFTFKKKRSLILIAVPVIYGVIFSLSLIYFIKGSISAIAIGAGSIILGIAMSYSIHSLSTTFSCKTVEQAISELAVPLTIGSFTTIGAFLALIFTTSPLLGDFGLFASLSLIGTTIFCLIFLPHFISYSQKEIDQFENSFWYKITKYNFESNKIILIIIICISVISLFNYHKVEFDYDMLHINYEPPHLKEGLTHIKNMSNDDMSTLMISSSNNNHKAIDKYKAANDSLNILVTQKKVTKFSSAANFIYSIPEQQTKIERWNNFWSKEKIAKLKSLIHCSSLKYGFKENSFENFYYLLNKKYSPKNLTDELLQKPNIITNFIEKNDNNVLLLSQVWIAPNNSTDVYNILSKNTTIVDRSYYISIIAKSISEDFNFILLISSLLIFIVLYFSYGRLELTLLAFTPMCLSWIIILGIMPILGIKFNIINIILSTFIFGIGDDFSIFVLDGLTARYRNGRSTIIAHKSAILLSAIVTIIGMAALLFAKHPAIYSLSLVSLLGISVVVIISYTLQPFLYNIFISHPAQKNLQPITLRSMIRSFLPFFTFFISCIIIHILIIPLFLFPIKKKYKQLITSYLIKIGCRITIFMDFSLKKFIPQINIDKPSIIIANHQSFIDILVLIATIPKAVIIGKSWVWNSPFFGFIIREAGFLYSNYGLEKMITNAKEQIKFGYSIVVFPEGSRSTDLKLHRFHKGAFMLAHKLHLNIIPIALYGNGYVLNKNQTLILRRGVTSCKQLATLHYDSEWNKNNFKDIVQTAYDVIQKGYNELEQKYREPNNSYYKDKLRYNYSFKGLIVEQYMNVKLIIEKYYIQFHKLIPLRAKIYDIGCGYGSLSTMLAMLSPNRNIIGIDYDANKIDLIQHSSLRPHNAFFINKDVTQFQFENADIFIINDMLHYVSKNDQQEIIYKCARHLNIGGHIIIRDGNLNDRKHKITRLTEFISTKILKFNKSIDKLNFITSEMIQKYAKELGLKYEVIDLQKGTSNTTYLLSKQ